MQCACAILSSVACPALQHFSTLSHKWHDFWGEKVTGGKKCIFWFSPQLYSETFLDLRRIRWDIFIKIHGSRRQVPVILARYWSTDFSREIFEKYTIMKFMKISSAGAESFLADGLTDRQLIAALRNVTNAPKNTQFIFIYELTIRIREDAWIVKSHTVSMFNL